ncbi:MAG: AMP-binding protein [Thermoleophilaceae bacterium]|nr:AMP-binding protein [Thermoleophilaceae bacterium]
MNFIAQLIEESAPGGHALIAIGEQGERSEVTFGALAERTARLSGHLAALGLARGDVVVTLLGSRPEWVYAMCGSLRGGLVVLPCAEQLRAADLAKRLEISGARAVITDSRNLATVEQAGFTGIVVDGGQPPQADPAPAADLDERDPALMLFTSGTSGAPKPILHGQRFLSGQTVQAEHWFGAQPGEVAWCTGTSGWSKSARNVFLAPWLGGATALLEDARFDPARRLETLQRERVNVLCMAPTEYRALVKRTDLGELPDLRHAVAAGEPLNPEVIRAFHAATGIEIHDGYGQTETGALTGMPIGAPVRPGSMGKPLPGIDAWVEDGELCVAPESVPTFSLGAPDGPWRTGDRVREDEEGYLWFEGRADDVIISAGYRIGPFEVESALISHASVLEAAAVAAPDELRGQIVRAIVVLRDGVEPCPALTRELQEHVKDLTAPYKYPRVIDYAPSLPKTASGKIQRALLRAAP